MEKEVKLFTEALEVLKWMKEQDVFMPLTQPEIQVLLNYLEGHDYAIGTDKEGNLFRVDISMENGDKVEYSMDELIDLVCEWNYELIQDADYHRKNPKDMLDFAKEQSRYESYKQDEVMLDHMFEYTKYGKELDILAEQLASQIVEAFTKGEDMDKTLSLVAGSVKEYQEERGR